MLQPQRSPASNTRKFRAHVSGEHERQVTMAKSLRRHLSGGAPWTWISASFLKVIGLLCSLCRYGGLLILPWSKDSSVSGQSMSKFLNRLSNRIVRELLVQQPSQGETGVVIDAANFESELPSVRDDFIGRFGSSDGFDDALRYLDRVSSAVILPMEDQALLGDGALPSGAYAAAFRRFTSVLSQFGCLVGTRSSLVNGHVPSLVDRNFCLSISDQLSGQLGGTFLVALETPAASAPLETAALPFEQIPTLFQRFLRIVRPNERATKAAPWPPTASPKKRSMAVLTESATATKCLNALSNRVQRTVLFGEEADIAALNSALVDGKAAFVDKWTDDAATAYYDALCALSTKL
jgi:hypothetical protein